MLAVNSAALNLDLKVAGASLSETRDMSPALEFDDPVLDIFSDKSLKQLRPF